MVRIIRVPYFTVILTLATVLHTTGVGAGCAAAMLFDKGFRYESFC